MEKKNAPASSADSSCRLGPIGNEFMCSDRAFEGMIESQSASDAQSEYIRDYAILPRKKAGQAGSVERSPVLLTRELLERYFGMPLNTASKELGICATAIKKVCRKLGILKWPFRDRHLNIRPGSESFSIENGTSRSEGISEPMKVPLAPEDLPTVHNQGLSDGHPRGLKVERSRLSNAVDLQKFSLCGQSECSSEPSTHNVTIALDEFMEDDHYLSDSATDHSSSETIDVLDASSRAGSPFANAHRPHPHNPSLSHKASDEKDLARIKPFNALAAPEPRRTTGLSVATSWVSALPAHPYDMVAVLSTIEDGHPVDLTDAVPDWCLNADELAPTSSPPPSQLIIKEVVVEENELVDACITDASPFLF